MKFHYKLNGLLLLALIVICAKPVLAQNKADVFDTNTPITWLGLDYSLTQFVGVHDATSTHVVTNDEFRDRYTLELNQLMMDQPKKFDFAKATHRAIVKNAPDVAEDANKGLNKFFFLTDPSSYKPITEATIITTVKNYNFKNNQGLGLIFFVDEMNKNTALSSVWVTFVDMQSRTVLFTKYMTGKANGFGFRNYWANPYYHIIKDMYSDFDGWKKGK